MGIEKGTYRIKNHASWTVLDESTDDRHIIHGWQQTNKPNQHWDVIDSGSGAFHLQNVGSKLFLHADGASDGARLVGSSNLSPWYLDQQADGSVYIIFPGSNRVADLDNGNVADGTTIHLWERNSTGAKQQQWFFEKV
ncbi:hypothetical protein RSOLAG22IIIB_13029 [Rhizoctonia solani]|uniref:Ricin B lectin domain-containing protein n=1 Tax=Rhizoctonia solani TaxID=456999 RepID=A0A0K6GI08_9AGAM|nr:hypothetical protein RSOLAG22IIIB_13029 [Rhizoctonia solani]